MGWSIRNCCLSILLVMLLLGCESMSRYFIHTETYSDTIKVTVKVDYISNLPVAGIPVNTGQYKHDISNYETEFFTKRLSVFSDSIEMAYSFIQAPGTTVWLQPTKIGPPAIQYIIINNKDTVTVPGSSFKLQSNFKFRKLINQKFVLQIK